MDDLTLVGVHEDGEHLLLVDGAGSAVPAARWTRRCGRPSAATERGSGQLQIEIEGRLRPREIQARIRAGETRGGGRGRVRACRSSTSGATRARCWPSASSSPSQARNVRVRRGTPSATGGAHRRGDAGRGRGGPALTSARSTPRTPRGTPGAPTTAPGAVARPVHRRRQAARGPLDLRPGPSGTSRRSTTRRAGSPRTSPAAPAAAPALAGARPRVRRRGRRHGAAGAPRSRAPSTCSTPCASGAAAGRGPRDQRPRRTSTRCARRSTR